MPSMTGGVTVLGTVTASCEYAERHHRTEKRQIMTGFISARLTKRKNKKPVSDKQYYRQGYN
jgi:hypothetical protein